jgi:membrane-associated phospholipid phosphatase
MGRAPGNPGRVLRVRGTLVRAGIAWAACCLLPCALPDAVSAQVLVPAAAIEHRPVIDDPAAPAGLDPRPFRQLWSADTIGGRLGQAESPPPPAPERSGFGAAARSVASDFASFPTRRSTWVILGIGGAAAGLAYPFDAEINDELQESETLQKVMAPGAYLGHAWVQASAALGLYVAGRFWLPPAPDGRRNKAAHVGLDLLRSTLLTSTLTYGIKETVRRDRPTGDCCSFPSGHASLTFATAAVLERHFGYRASWPMFAIAGYVAASRLTENQHYLSDVLFGSAFGMACGWTVVGRHGRGGFALTPAPIPGGIALSATW